MQEIFIKRLIELMESENMTQIELANRIGTTNVTISRYLNGARSPRIEIVSEIANVFHVSVDYLLGFTNVRERVPIQNESVSQLYQIVKNLGFLNSKKLLSEKQLGIIKKLLDANKDFIIPLKDDSNVVNQ